MRKKQITDQKIVTKKSSTKKLVSKKNLVKQSMTQTSQDHQSLFSSTHSQETPSKVVEAELVSPTSEDDFFTSDEVVAVPISEFEPEPEQILKSSIEKEKKLPTVIEKSITSSDPLTLYLSELRRYPLLTKEQEFEVAKKYFDTKDPESAQLLVKSNLRFVVKIAAEYSKFGSKMIDLIQEGNVGLMHAVREFNPYKGNRLITYAVWWIRGYIQEYLMRQYSMVRIGTTQNQRKLFYQLQKQKQKLDSVDFETNIEAISAKLGIPENEVRDMAQRVSNRDVNLDKPVDDSSGSGLKFGDLQKDSSEISLDDKLAHQEELSILRKNLDELRKDLNEREIILLEERLLNDEPLTLQEIGEKYGITREAVRQAEVRLMKKIKTKMGADPT